MTWEAECQGSVGFHIGRFFFLFARLKKRLEMPSGQYDFKFVYYKKEDD